MSRPKRGLGRGLDALLRKGDEVRRLPVDELEPNRLQPRRGFDERGIAELADSIRRQGVLQPLVVTRNERGGYTIVAGERRWRAARQAGLDSVPVMVREVTADLDLLELALVENLQRADLDPIEEAEAYQALRRDFGLSQEEIATRVGKGRATVANALRLLKLPAEVQDLLREGRLRPGQARPLLSIADGARQLELARRAAEEGMTSRSLEREARPPRRRRHAPPVDVHLADAAERLTRRLQTRVEIARRPGGGFVKIHFHSDEELMRLFELLVR